MSKERCVNKLLLAGAIAATAALIVPGFAQAPATPPAPPAAAAPSAGPEPPASDQGDGAMMHREGGWGMRGMMMRRMMAGRMMMRNPQQGCVDRLAWRAARRAYVEAKLDLTPQQRPLWDKVEAVAENAEQKERQLCRQLTTPAEATVLDRMDRAQQFLTARLDALQAAKPAVQALYQSLTPEQKAIFDHPFRRD
jgi:LTXXQ motif family protein